MHRCITFETGCTLLDRDAEDPNKDPNEDPNTSPNSLYSVNWDVLHFFLNDCHDPGESCVHSFYDFSAH